MYTQAHTGIAHSVIMAATTQSSGCYYPYASDGETEATQPRGLGQVTPVAS